MRMCDDYKHKMKKYKFFLESVIFFWSHDILLVNFVGLQVSNNCTIKYRIKYACLHVAPLKFYQMTISSLFNNYDLVMRL